MAIPRKSKTTKTRAKYAPGNSRRFRGWQQLQAGKERRANNAEEPPPEEPPP